MRLKQISLTLPEGLLQASKEFTDEMGYRNVQELIVELLRNKLVMERIERYRQIESEMKQGHNVKRFTQKDAKKYLKSL